MARRKHTRKNRKTIALALVAIAVLAVIALALAFRDWRMLANKVEVTLAGGSAPLAVSSVRIDAANEGRNVRISGELEIAKPPVDPQLGITAKAAILFRHVEMYQWQEHCAADDCTYAAVWSAQPQDSHKFRTPGGHANPSLPFIDVRFAAGEIRLGAFAVEPALLAAQATAVDYPVRATALPANLAASFADVDGVLYAGGDAAHPQVGALRISYRIVPVASVSLTGLQRGSHLTTN